MNKSSNIWRGTRCSLTPSMLTAAIAVVSQL